MRRLALLFALALAALLSAPATLVAAGGPLSEKTVEQIVQLKIDARNSAENQVLGVAFHISRSADSYFFERKSRVAPLPPVTIKQ